MNKIILQSFNDALDALKGIEFLVMDRNSPKLSEKILKFEPPDDLLGKMAHHMVSDQTKTIKDLQSRLIRYWGDIEARDLIEQLNYHGVDKEDLSLEVLDIKYFRKMIDLITLSPDSEIDDVYSRFSGKLGRRRLTHYCVLLSIATEMRETLPNSACDRIENWLTWGSPQQTRLLLNKVVYFIKKRRISDIDSGAASRRRVVHTKVLNHGEQVEKRIREVDATYRHIPGKVDAGSHSDPQFLGTADPAPVNLQTTVQMPPPILPETPDREVLLFQAMNQATHDHLLDRLHEASHLRDRYRKGQVSAEEFADFLSPVLVNLFKFFRSKGLQPEMVPGKTLSLHSAEESLAFDYRGSEFRPGEVKQVQVESPGWRLGDHRVSRASVREISQTH